VGCRLKVCSHGRRKFPLAVRRRRARFFFARKHGASGSGIHYCRLLIIPEMGRRSFWGIPSPWISGIIELGENSEVIYGAQWFRGKILSRKELAPVGRFSRIPLSPWLVSARWVRWPQGLGSHWCVIARRGFGKNECNVPSGSCEEIVFCRKGVRMRFRRWLLGRGEIEGLGFKWVLVRN
jgi:hypothetical protein